MKQEIIQEGVRMWKKGRKNKTGNKAEFYLFSNFKKPGLCLTIEIVFMWKESHMFCSVMAKACIYHNKNKHKDKIWVLFKWLQCLDNDWGT